MRRTTLPIFAMLLVLSWLVGWVEREGAVTALFALLLAGEAGDIQRARWPLAPAALETRDVIDEE